MVSLSVYAMQKSNLRRFFVAHAEAKHLSLLRAPQLFRQGWQLGVHGFPGLAGTTSRISQEAVRKEPQQQRCSSDSW